MGTRAERNRTNPDLGVLAGRLLFAIQQELFTTLAAQGFEDLLPRHGAVLAYLDSDGVRATDLSRLSGQHKQVIGTMVDELEGLGYVERRPTRPTAGPNWSAPLSAAWPRCGRPTRS